MLFSLFQWNSEENKAAKRLYDSIVKQARQKEFYSSYSVPDTVEGRFEMVALHLFLFVQRLKSENQKDHNVGKLVLETFFSEMDATLREMGVGDMGVPKKMRKISDSFFGRAYSYSEALESGDIEQLKKAIERNIYAYYQGEKKIDGSYSENDLTGISEYILESYKAVCKNPIDELLGGVIHFSDVKV